MTIATLIRRDCTIRGTPREGRTVHTGRINLGAALVVVGLLLLMMNWGFLDWSLWWNLLQWWPAFLIAIGLHLVFRRTRFWFLPTLFALLIVVFAVSVGSVNVADWQPRTLSARVPLEDHIKDARLRLDMGTGMIRLAPGGAGLYEADFKVYGEEPSQVQLPHGQSTIVELRQEDRRAPKWVRGLSERWDIRLARAIPIDVEVSAAAVNLEVNCTDLQLRTLDMSAGLGWLELRLGETGRRTDVFINATLRGHNPGGAQEHRSTGQGGQPVFVSQFARSGVYTFPGRISNS